MKTKTKKEIMIDDLMELKLFSGKMYRLTEKLINQLNPRPIAPVTDLVNSAIECFMRSETLQVTGDLNHKVRASDLFSAFIEHTNSEVIVSNIGFFKRLDRYVKEGTITRRKINGRRYYLGLYLTSSI